MFDIFNSAGEHMATVKSIDAATVWVDEYGQEEERYSVRPA